MAFVPLFCQSHYSPLGVSSPSELVLRARDMGYTTLGLCDEATMAGFHEFDRACRTHGLRPIFGCALKFEGLVDTAELYPYNFLIETEQGYRNLVRLVTNYHERSAAEPGSRKRFPLRGRVGGLRVVLPTDGELGQLVRAKDRDRAQQFLERMMETLGDAGAVGIDPPGLDDETNEMLRRLAAFVKAPALASTVAYYPEPADAAAFEFLRHRAGATDQGWTPPRDHKSSAAIFSEDDMLARYGEAAEAAHEAGEIARRCSWRPGGGRGIIPVQDFERGFDANSYLFDLAISGATERYGEITEELKKRMGREFEEIKTKDLAPYLLLSLQIAKRLDADGISRGVGRGPIVASLIAYCVGLTNIDPMEYRLAYHPLVAEGECFAPIRVEIPSSAAAGLIDWLIETHGEGRVVRIGRRTESRRDQMIDELADWASMTRGERETAHLEKSRRRASGTAARLRKALADKRFRRWRDPAFLVDLALRLAPRPKPLVAAPGRWTLSAEALEFVLPVAVSEAGERVTDMDEDAIDQMGAPRLEFVPHHLLNLLDRARMVAAASTPGFSPSTPPMGDRATFDLLEAGQTIGIPPLETPSVKSLLRRQKPTDILQVLRVRTDANRGRVAEKTRDLIDELPDVLISYQCAYFKANYVGAFYAGALSSAAELGDDLSVLARAVRRAELEILAPDINLSGSICTLHDGSIRLGLRMVRRLGEKACEEIYSVRKSGRFESFGEFCDRVSARTINHRLLSNLIGAGAFDALGQNRASMDAALEAMPRRGRAGGTGAAEQAGAQAELFEIESAEEPSPRSPNEPAPEIKPWSRVQTEEREKEALGFNIHDDPAARYPGVFASLRPFDPSQVTMKMHGTRVQTAGLIDAIDIEGLLIEAEGGALIDLEGLAVWLEPEKVTLAGDALKQGAEVLVIGKLNASEGFARLDAEGVWLLEALEGQSRQVAKVRLDLSGESRATLGALLDLARHFRGESRLEPVNFSNPRSWNLRRLARTRVFFCAPFFQALGDILRVEQIELIDDQGQTLRIDLGHPQATAQEAPPPKADSPPPDEPVN